MFVRAPPSLVACFADFSFLADALRAARPEQPQRAERERGRRKHEARALEPVKPSGRARGADVVSRC